MCLQVQQFIDYILAHQSADGWLGPNDISNGNCYWSKYPILLALRQVHSEAHAPLHVHVCVVMAGVFCGIPGSTMRPITVIRE